MISGIMHMKFRLVRGGDNEGKGQTAPENKRGFNYAQTEK